MKIFDAIYTAAVFLQLDSLTDAMNDENFDKENLTADTARELDILLRCCNLVLHELAASDFPLKSRIKLTSRSGRIEKSELPQKIADIYSVEKDGKRLPFCEFFDCITVPEDGEVTVTYSFEPSDAALGDDSPYAGNRPSARLVAYGVAREYCLISGMTDDAAMWDGRFAACAEEESLQKKEMKVRARRWI